MNLRHDSDIPRIACMHSLPVAKSEVVPSFAANGRRFATAGSSAACCVSVDLTRAKPCNITVAVVLLILSRDRVVGVCQLAFDEAVCAGLRDLVIVSDPSSTDDNPGAKLAEDRSCDNNAYVAALVAAGQDFSFDQVFLLGIVDKDLVKFWVLCEEEIAVAEPAASSRLSGQHVKFLAASLDRECAHAVFSASQQVTVLVDLLVALVVLVDLRLIVDHVVLGSLEHDMRRLWWRTLPPPSESSATRSNRPSSLPLERCARLAPIVTSVGCVEM
jgi:hypothetical protein